MRAVVACVALMVLSSCGDIVPAVECVPHGAALNAPERVTARDGRFWLGDAPFRFAGTGLYYALEASQTGQMDKVEAVFDDAAARGMTVIRVWAFNTDLDSGLALHRGPGDIDEDGLRALDRVVAAAAERGLRLILVLTNHWDDYGGLGVYGDWVGLDNRAEVMASEAVIAHVSEYARALAGRVNSVNGRRYARDPAILGWEIINEPRCQDEGCTPEITAAFVSAVAGALREADPNHLIGVGDEGFLGEEGVDIRLHAESGAFDWVSVHLWPHAHDPLLSVSGDWTEAKAAEVGRQRIKSGAKVADRHGVPLVIGEFGWPVSAGSEVERAAIYASWEDAARRYGADGLILWMLADPDRPDYDGFALSIDGPATPVQAVCLFPF